LTKREEDAFDIVEVQILRHLKPIIEIPCKRAEELTAEEGDFSPG
jgi:hypothetical protein